MTGRRVSHADVNLKGFFKDSRENSISHEAGPARRQLSKSNSQIEGRHGLLDSRQASVKSRDSKHDKDDKDSAANRPSSGSRPLSKVESMVEGRRGFVSSQRQSFRSSRHSRTHSRSQSRGASYTGEGGMGFEGSQHGGRQLKVQVSPSTHDMAAHHAALVEHLEKHYSVKKRLSRMVNDEEGADLTIAEERESKERESKERESKDQKEGSREAVVKQESKEE